MLIVKLSILGTLLFKADLVVTKRKKEKETVQSFHLQISLWLFENGFTLHMQTHAKIHVTYRIYDFISCRNRYWLSCLSFSPILLLWHDMISLNSITFGHKSLPSGRFFFSVLLSWVYYFIQNTLLSCCGWVGDIVYITWSSLTVTLSSFHWVLCGLHYENFHCRRRR